MERRDFLSASGTAAFGWLTGSATAADDGREGPRPLGTGTPGNDEQLPIHASGWSIHRYRRAGDGFVHRKWFVSDDLWERYGDPVMEYGPTDVPENRVTKELRNRDGAIYRFRDSQVVGTAAEHDVAEKRILRQARAQAGDVTVQQHLTDELPLYHYESSSDAGEKQSRKAPINVGWENADSAAWVKEVTEGECEWEQIDLFPEEPRYINDGGTIKSTDEHVMDRIFLTEQWHARLYEIGHDRYDVVGQAHRDPINHNQFIRLDDWHFEAARAQLADCWTTHRDRSTYLAILDNGADWDSHDGRIAIMKE